MSVRELLEAAAKAAGHVGARYDEVTCCIYTAAGWRWNPLADDGDAFRLQCLLGLRVRIDLAGGCVECDLYAQDGGHWVGSVVEEIGADGLQSILAAARLVIVKAAGDPRRTES